MISQSLASSRYGKHYTRDRERIRSRINKIDEFREVATSNNIKNMVEYRVFAKCIDDLTSADSETGARVLRKTSLTILLKNRQFTRLSMRNRCGIEKPVRNRETGAE
jgi:hypothetical protein